MRVGVKGLTSHFMCVQSFHMVNIDVLAGVGAPQLDTHLDNYKAQVLLYLRS